MSEAQAIYLNIGCGSVKLPGFINIDLDPGADLQLDIRGGLPFEDNSVRGIYSEHFIEHLTQAEILSFLRECRRTLIPGGTVRIATPDLATITRHYIENDWQQPWLTTYGYQWIRNRAEYLNVSLRHWGHAWVIDEEELCRLAELSGLSAPVRRAVGQSGDPALEGLETRIESTLIMEFGKQRHPITDQPLVSIVIPAYKAEYFAESLDSALHQTYPHLEILILDDSAGSNIETLYSLIAGRDERVSYFRNTPPLGEPENLTKGICLARGEFIKPLYDDDVLLPEAVAQLVSAFQQTPDARLAAGRRLPIDSTGTPLDKDTLGPALAITSGPLNGAEVIGQIVTSGINNLGEPTVMMFRRADALAIDEPNVMSLFGRLCYGIGDVCLASHFLSRGDLAYVAQPIAHFRLHADQTQKQAGFAEKLQATWIYFRQHAARLGLNPPKNPVRLNASGQLETKRHRFAPPLEHPIEPEQPKRHGSPSGRASSANLSENNYRYGDWLINRQRVFEENGGVELAPSSIGEKTGKFQIFLRLLPGAESLLADTLDSLNQQCVANWHLDIITQLPEPSGVNEIPNLGWHSVDDLNHAKERIDFLVETGNCDWIIEMPAGAILDPLFIWRLTRQTSKFPTARAFFVDDDCHDKSGNRLKPRFKPGVNPAALLAADLAGPICIQRAVWLQSGGASPHHGSPWFAQLLRITDQYGWGSIAHIPDVLISYPEKFPTDVEACIVSLVKKFSAKAFKGEIIPVSGDSWNIRYPLAATPAVSIIVNSRCQLDLLSRCLDSLITKTRYPDFEVIIAIAHAEDEPDLDIWLTKTRQQSSTPLRISQTTRFGNFAARCNAGVKASAHELVLLISEEAVVIQENWLEELVRTCQMPDVAAASPRLIAPGSGLMRGAAHVLGLEGVVGSPYQNDVELGTRGYLDMLQLARDVSALPANCMLVRKAAYLAAGGMDDAELGDHFADTDFCLKLLTNHQRLIYQPLATVVLGGEGALRAYDDLARKHDFLAAQSKATTVFYQRWQAAAAVDRFWNPNLSLACSDPQPEDAYRPAWQHLPVETPRILARTLTNGQGAIRLSTPLRALRKAGLASECIWPQEGEREPGAAEILRLAPTAMIVQNYLNDLHLPALHAWHSLPGRPFMVYALDDLITDMAASNYMRKNIPAAARARLKYALERCDRMVVSTEFLAETYRKFIPDIRIMPNLLEQEVWLPLSSQKRSSHKPRIGWAGGTTHQGDLVLLKEIIEQTRDEADWVFFGMCPSEIRPLIAEFHPFADFFEYPARLADLNLDIAVAPLAEIPFNQGKSNLRLLEYGILGIPVVCTDIDPYRNSPACCVPNTSTAWVEALRARIYDADGREREGAAMHKWVQKHYLLENNLETWLAAYLPD